MSLILTDPDTMSLLFFLQNLQFCWRSLLKSGYLHLGSRGKKIKSSLSSSGQPRWCVVVQLRASLRPSALTCRVLPGEGLSRLLLCVLQTPFLSLRKTCGGLCALIAPFPYLECIGFLLVSEFDRQALCWLSFSYRSREASFLTPLP